MHLSRIAFLGGLFTVALGRRARGELNARQDSGYYGYGSGNDFLTYLLPPISSSSASNPTTISPLDVSGLLPSGTAFSATGQSGFSTGLLTSTKTDPAFSSLVTTGSPPYSNPSSSQSAFSTGFGSGTAISKFPSPTAYPSSPMSGNPTVPSNITAVSSKSGSLTASSNPTNPGSKGTSSGVPAFSYLPHRPYPFPPHYPIPTGSGTAGTAPVGLSTAGFYPTHVPYPFPSASGYPFKSFTIITAGTSPINPSSGGFYPTHGPYPFPPRSRDPFTVSSFGTSGTGSIGLPSGIAYPTHGPYSLPSGSGYSFKTSPIGTVGTVLSRSSTGGIYPTHGPYTFPSGSGFQSSGSVFISTRTASLQSTAIGTSITTYDPSSIATSPGYSVRFGTRTSLLTTAFTSYGSSLTVVPTTLGTVAKFTYTPTSKTQPSEYYHHHRRPHHHHKEEDGYDSFGEVFGGDFDGYDYKS